MNKQLLVLPLGSGLTAKDREKLSKAGFVGLELEHPEIVRLVPIEAPEARANDMAYAALKAISESGIESVGMRFTRHFIKQIEDRRATNAGAP